MLEHGNRFRRTPCIRFGSCDVRLAAFFSLVIRPQVIYNKPVNVSGTPRVLFVLDSDNDNDTASESYASYDPTFNIGRCMKIGTQQSIDIKYTPAGC